MRGGALYLDGPRLRRCLQSGLQALISERDYLNKINVFPVPDGDTGNNLAHTARAALQGLINQPETSVGKTLRVVADAALDGAQGNSGVILAQYLQALADATQTLQRMSAAEFSAAIATAAVQTRKALAEPREGTVLTVMDITAATAVGQTTEDFAELLPQLVAAAEQAVQHTTEQMDVLAAAHVVDAGAYGFCALLRGCNDYLQSGSLRDVVVIEQLDIPEVFQHDHSSEDPRFRYCTECLIAGNNLQRADISAALTQLGDSIVVAGSASRIRMHIHTDTPEIVFDLAATWGEVIKTKADDMRQQTRALRDTDRKLAIVTDSGADIPQDVMTEKGIHMVPLRVQIGDESYMDKTGLAASELDRLLRATQDRAGTSQPTPGDLRRMFEFLGTHFEQILAIHLSNKLSGTFNGAQAAANSFDTKVALLDSLTTSVGQGLIVYKAAELAADNTTRDAIIAQLQPLIAQTKSYALVPDLTPAVRSGRLKPWIKMVADTLRLTPILADTPDGRISAQRFLPGRGRLTERFGKHIGKQLTDNQRWRIAIGHGPQNKSAAMLLGAQLRQQLTGSEIIWTTEIGAALGLHAGMGTLVVAAQPALEN